MSEAERPVRGRRTVGTVVLAILFLAGFAVCMFPYINLAEGSFLYAVLSGLYTYAVKYAGFFASGPLAEFTLLPAVVFLLLTMFDYAIHAKFITWLLELLEFTGLYLVCAWLWGSGSDYPLVQLLPPYYLFIGAGLTVVCLVLLVFIAAGSRKKRKNGSGSLKKQRKASAAQAEGEQSVDTAAEDPVARRASEMSHAEALDSLTAVEVPEYETFPTYVTVDPAENLGTSVHGSLYSTAFTDGNMGRESFRQRQEEEERRRVEEEEKNRRLEKIFGLHNIRRKLDEEARAEQEFAGRHNAYGGTSYGGTSSYGDTAQMQQPYTQPAPQSVVQPQIIYVQPPAQPQVIVVQNGPDGQTRVTTPPVSPVQTGPDTHAETNPETRYSNSDTAGTAQFAGGSLTYGETGTLETENNRPAADFPEAGNSYGAGNKPVGAFAAMRQAREGIEAAETREGAQRTGNSENGGASGIQEENTIFYEGTENSSIDVARARYEQLSGNGGKQDQKKKDVDFTSAVAGLRKSKDGYFYDASKFEYKFPPESFLKHYEVSTQTYSSLEEDIDGQKIVETLKEFRIETHLIGAQHGPTFTLYELSLGKGIRVNAVLSLSDNIAYDLAVPNVRVLAPIPGKSAIGIEVPNKKRDTIGFDIMMPALKSRRLRIPMVLGKTITGEAVIIDLAGAPHLLIAGTTGSGKSVCVNSLICSVLYTKTPREVRMILVDPKMVELTVYNDIPHLLTPVITDPKKAIKAISFCVQEMERRMTMFSQLGVRNIEGYNKKIEEKELLREPLPYIMVIIDEFADLMSVVGKELEAYIKRIAAVARFTGIHLVLATQRPSADVITGIIKSNMPTQIAFAVSNQMNSRIILDTSGAEKLLGRGDMLYSSSTSSVLQRIQGAYIDTEIESIVNFVKTQGEPDYIDESWFEDDEDAEDEVSSTAVQSGEDMFTRAWKLVSERGEASASYIQRKLSIGYNRAATLIEELEDAGYIGPARGSKPREILRDYFQE